MAKTKALPGVDVPAENNPSVSLYDLKGKAPDLSVGDKVKVTITGKVKEVGERERYEKKGETVHNVSIERIDVEFMKLSEAEDMDMDEYVKWRGKDKEGKIK